MRPKIVTDLRCGRVSRKTSLDLPLLGSIYWAFLQFNYPNDANIARANYYSLGPEVRELFEI